MSYERIAVTGGSGLLGQHILRRLARRGSLTNIDHAAPAEPPSVTCRHISESITDYQAMREALRGHDALIHLAAIPNPRESTPEKTFRTNVLGAWTVMQAAEDVGIRRVVVASSDSVIGLSYNPPDWQPQYLPIDEQHPIRPSEVYSLSKRVTETVAEQFAVRGAMEVLAIRPSHVVFPREYPEIEARGADIDNYHFWCWVAPEDVAQAFDAALDLATPDGFEVFNIAAADGLNSRDTLELVRERWGAVAPLRRPQIYRDLPTASLLDTTKARERLGFVPAIDKAKLLDLARTATPAR